ncbi:MAG TPA: hypothetical protein PKE55_02075, partial [Kiritimatiellia bacterium]|nr:hypothetical protein [Kiritimatiellia bacterium]
SHPNTLPLLIAILIVLDFSLLPPPHNPTRGGHNTDSERPPPAGFQTLETKPPPVSKVWKSMLKHTSTNQKEERGKVGHPQASRRQAQPGLFTV